MKNNLLPGVENRYQLGYIFMLNIAIFTCISRTAILQYVETWHLPFSEVLVYASYAAHGQT
jgi:hypothetical protein